MWVKRIVAKTAAASVDATTPPSRTASGQARSKSSCAASAGQERRHRDADRAQERRGDRDPAHAPPRGREAALVEDRDEADDADRARQLGVVELDPAGPVGPEQHPESEEGDERGHAGPRGAEADGMLAASTAPTISRRVPSSMPYLRCSAGTPGAAGALLAAVPQPIVGCGGISIFGRRTISQSFATCQATAENVAVARRRRTSVGRRASGQTPENALKPPSTGTTMPVTKRAPSDASQHDGRHELLGLAEAPKRRALRRSWRRARASSPSSPISRLAVLVADHESRVRSR